MAHVSATEPCSSLLDSRTPLPSPPCVSCQSTGSLVHRVNPLCSTLAARDRKEVEGRGGIFRLLATAEPRESQAAVEARNSGEEKLSFRKRSNRSSVRVELQCMCARVLIYVNHLQLSRWACDFKPRYTAVAFS